MPELEHICAVEEMSQLRDAVGIKIPVVICIVNAVTDLGIGKVGQELGEHEKCSLGIGHLTELSDIVEGDRGNLGGDEKAAVL